MALTTTIGSASADSYASVAEADVYMAARGNLQLNAQSAEWSGLITAEKEIRLRLAASLLDSLTFRGIKATKAQALSFPRLFRGDDLWPKDDLGNLSDAYEYRYEDWDEITDTADAYGYTLPTIPQAIKDAQVETAFQVIHSTLAGMTPGESASGDVESITIGKLSISLGGGSSAGGNSSLFRSESLSAQTLIMLLLRPYVAKVRGFVV